jgi:TonB family protein
MRFVTLFLIGLATAGACLNLGGCAENPKAADKQEVLAAFQQEMRQAINAEKRFPYGASDTDARGEVTVDFDYTDGGKADNMEITKSSGNAYLDHAALMTVYFAKLPPEPPELKGITRFRITVNFGTY